MERSTVPASAPSDFDLSLCQLLNPEIVAAPWSLYHRIRNHDPVHWDIFLRAWVVTSYKDVAWVLRNLSANRIPSPEKMDALGLGDLSPISRATAKQMLFLDPPYHNRIRKLVASAFTPERVAALTQRLHTTAQKLVSKFETGGQMDLIADFAVPFPGMVIAIMLGVPEEQHPQLGLWATDFAETFGNFTQNPESTPRILRSCAEMTAFFRDCMYRSRSIPQGGMIQALIDAEIDGDRLSEEEVISNAIGVLVGGQETATHLIGTSLLTLFENPAHLAMLRADNPPWGPAMEELLRYNSPVQLTGRITTQDIQLGGKHIKSGESVIAVLASANRDSTRFTDPEKLDFFRADNKHLAFGWATHFCLGAALARLELRVALETLLRLPGLRVQSAEGEWRSHLVFRGLRTLPLSF